MSERDDNRGHWPAGKRRNEDVGDWSRTRLVLQALLNDHSEPGRISARQLAADLGVSDRSVRRWLAGEDRPEPEVQELIRTWIEEHKPRRRAR